MVGELTIDPSVVDLMRSGTRIVMRSPRISLNDAKLSQLLTGTTLELVPGEGEPQQRFNVLDSSETLLQQPGVLTVTLNAPQSYGIDVGQPLVVHGVKVGQILSRTLTAGGVVFTAAIDAQYRGLLHKDSKFVVNSRLDVKLALTVWKCWRQRPGMGRTAACALFPAARGNRAGQYPLYANSEKAEEGIVGNAPATTLTLSATSLPDVQAGSVVLYRKFQVGEIVNVRPKANEFEVDVYISPEYRKLLTRESIFWAEGGRQGAAQRQRPGRCRLRRSTAR
ncbi:paraquat-inducible protein B [Serratia marcescens]|uniref:Paraquat-inducible protein B n=1 Tax=Serratia marcescens TaxID=615 RepID=A0A379ZVA3_SERMA|nr:paraquat-inducible protein B [Serratia marcescens]